MIESVDNDGKSKSSKSGDSSTPVLDNFSRDLIKLAEQVRLTLLLDVNVRLTVLLKYYQDVRKITQ